MTGVVINNLIQQSSRDLSQPTKAARKDPKQESFFETMQEINKDLKRKNGNISKSSQKGLKKPATDNSAADDQEFLAELKKILAKNNKEIPAELLALLEGRSLTEQQKNMLGQMILNLQNQNLKISDLKSLVEKNAADLNLEKLNDAELKNNGDALLNSETKSEIVNLKSLEDLAGYLENNSSSLNQKEKNDLKAELNQAAESLLAADSLTEAENSRLNQLIKTEDLNLKINELAALAKDSEQITKNLEQILQTDKNSLPLMTELTGLMEQDSNNLSLGNNQLAELEAQLKEVTAENQNRKSAAAGSKLNSDKLEGLKLNQDFTADSIFKETSSDSKNNFFSLDQGEGERIVDFDFNNEGQQNNFVLNDLNPDSSNLSEIAEENNLKGQVVEQFKGQYSPETKEMQIQLKPDSLGKIDLSLSYENDKLIGKMLVESEVVRSQLESSLKGLKSDLLKQGINIEQFKIETAKNSPQQVEKQNEFAFTDQNSAFSDGDTGRNQEYDQRQFFQGQYYVQRNNEATNVNENNLIMRQQEIINRAAFSNDKLNLLA